MEAVTDFLFFSSKITADGDCSHEIKTLAPWEKKKKLWLTHHIKKQRYHFADKCLYSQSYGFSGSHVYMWELDHKEGWALKNRWFWTVVPGNSPESTLDCKIKPVNSKENQPWIEYSLEGLMLKLKLQYFGHLMRTADLIVKTVMLQKTVGRRRRGWQRIWN